MERALLLAKQGEGFTSPNPLVGAVIVKKDKIVSQGYHKKSGLAHAEIEAINKISLSSCRGATLYVNLEPCSHFGKTPPCVDRIIKMKFRRVVIATKDPTQKVNGKSIRKLKKAGVKTSVGLLKSQASKLNEVFFKNSIKSMPFVVAKVAQSLDGKIATRKGISKWITGQDSRKMSKALRDKYDSVLVGVNTVLKDNPVLAGLKRVPFRVVIDPSLKINPKAHILKHNPTKTIIITASGDKVKLKKLPGLVTVLTIKRDKAGLIPIKKILKSLYSLGIMSVFVEGGSRTIGNFFDHKLIDKVFFFIAPKIIGGKDALSSIGAKGFAALKDAPGLKDVRIERVKQDIIISGYPKY